MTLLEFSRAVNNPVTTLVEQMVKEAPLLNYIPAEPTIEGRQVKFAREESISADSGRAVGADHTASDDTDTSYITKQLIVRYSQFKLDRYFNDGEFQKEQKLAKANRSLALSLNNRIINGTEDATSFNGLSTIAELNEYTGTNGTAVTTEATALSFLEDLEDGMTKMLNSATHILVGSWGYKTFKRAAIFTKDIIMNDSSNVVAGVDLGYAIIGTKKLPIVWAGQKVDRNEVITGSAGGTTDVYLVDFTNQGVTLALEYGAIPPIDNSANKVYTLEQYQMLCDKSIDAVYKHTQTCPS